MQQSIKQLLNRWFNQLWVRLGLMITGVFISVFLLQFVAFVIIPYSGPGDNETVLEDLLVFDQNEMNMAEDYFYLMLISVPIGLVGGLLIGRLFGAPINDLVDAARKIGDGDLSTRVKVSGTEEMTLLGDTFNKMAADLQEAEAIRHNLMADVSHELRTPLTILEGNLRAALDHIYDLDEAEIANMYGQTHHLIRLVNDLRELSLADARQLQMQKQPVHVNTLIVETVQAVDPLAVELGVELTNQAPDFPTIEADPSRIKQVFFNLLTNALRHTPKGGQISVSGSQDGPQLQISIKDSGEGLEPDQLHAVFDRFYRADKSRSRETGGTGLGLSIVKAIMEAHEGSITARSEGKNKGSEFVLTLPV